MGILGAVVENDDSPDTKADEGVTKQIAVHPKFSTEKARNT